MSSIIDGISCPICGSEAYHETWYEAGEENIQCHHCGYGRRMYISNQETQQELGADWRPSFKIEEVKGFGCYKLLGKREPAWECGAFTTKEAISEFIDHVQSIKDELDHAEYSVITPENIIENYILITGPEGRTWQNTTNE
jgi:Zn ribbon nucleic-acid-binding protein